MKKKRKLGRQLLSFLLTLAMVVGLMPGMSMTARADAPIEIRMSGQNVQKGAENWTPSNSRYELGTGSYRLESDIEVNGSAIYVIGDVTLDLNGYGIKHNKQVSVVTVESNASLTLLDSNTGDRNHKYTFDKYGRAVVNDQTEDSNARTFSGGYITGGMEGVQVVQGTFLMKGGTIIGNFTGARISSGSSFTMYEGSILGNRDSNAGSGVSSEGTFQMLGGTIAENSSDTSAVFIAEKGTFSMQDGSITDNKGCLRGVEVYGHFEMSGGSITDHEGDYGSGVYVGRTGTFEMSGGNITGNAAATNGGGVFVDRGRFEMSGGNITGNAAATYGGGVYLCKQWETAAKMFLSGNAIIKDNAVLNSEDASNVYLQEGCTIILDAALTNTTPIGVMMQTPGVFTDSSDGEAVKAKDYLDKFISESIGYTVAVDGDELKLSDKVPQTITAENLTVSYGDTGKAVRAGTDGDGVIRYAVKAGSEEYIEVNAETGSLKIKKVGTAVVIVTASETDSYLPATKEVTVEISKGISVASKVIANDRIFDGKLEPLVTIDDSILVGGKMQYALGDANGATQPFTTDIPAKTDAGTYYVWYKAVGDSNHADTTPAAVTVMVGKADLDLSVSLKGWVYGAEANTPEVTGNTGKGTVTYTYKAKDADDKNYSDAVPTAAGTYTVKATVAETDNYNAGTATADFIISKEDDSSKKDDTAPTPDPDAPTPAPTPAEPDGANDWNLFEDASVHYFKVKDASVNGTVENSNENSKAYYSAKISGSTIAVSVTGDRKAAAKKNNTILEFTLSDGSVIEYTLPVCYAKPNFKLNSPSGTVKNGAESVLKFTLLVKGDAKKTVPYDMTDVKVSGDGLGSVSKAADGRIEVKTSSAGKGKITVTKEGWDPSNPVKLSYKVKAVNNDVMALEPEVKNIIINSNAKGQIFTYDVSINNLAPEAGKIEIVDKKDCGLVEASGNKIIVSYKDGVKAGNYTVGIKAGNATRNLKIKVSDKALADSVKLKVLRPYDVVTRQGMVVSASLKDVGGKIEAVTVAEEGFSVRLNSDDTFFIDYSGTKYDMKNLDMGTLNLGIKINGINEPVKLSLDKLKAKKKAPKAVAAAVIIPKDKEFSEGSVIGTANIVSSVKLNTGRSIILEVEKTEIVSEKGVTAKINANDPKFVNITGMEKNSGTVTVKLTYVGGATKTVKIKVRKK